MELAVYLGVQVSTIRKWRILRKGPKFIKIGSLVRYRKSDVEAYLDSCPTSESEVPDAKG
jgi:excisionase family DNA binding protein